MKTIPFTRERFELLFNAARELYTFTPGGEQAGELTLNIKFLPGEGGSFSLEILNSERSVCKEGNGETLEDAFHNLWVKVFDEVVVARRDNACQMAMLKEKSQRLFKAFDAMINFQTCWKQTEQLREDTKQGQT